MKRIAFLLLAAAFIAACQKEEAAAPPTETGTTLANPASENCVKKGGQISIETSGGGGQYGVCLFEDNRQCEEWALLRGACPDGGIKVTGYVTDAGRYCAIRGGTYAVTREATADTPEQGNCRLPDGETCAASPYYDGTCPQS